MILEKIETKYLNTNEKIFLSFLKGDSKYPYKGDMFRFLIIKTNISKDMIASFFESLLKDLSIYRLEDLYIVIYNNKERVEIENFADMFNEDVGYKALFFEGFVINKNNRSKFIDFLEMFICNYQFTNTYSNISDFILAINDKKELLKELRTIVLSKYLNDNSFLNMVNALFKDNLNVSKAASDLYMHRNTLNNKLYSFKNETTLSIQNFNDAVALYELIK